MAERLGILVVSYGSRAAAMMDALSRSDSYSPVFYVADKQANPYNVQKAEESGGEHKVIKGLSVDGIVEFAKGHASKIGFSIVGPEGPIIDGVGNRLEDEVGISTLCPKREYAIEGRKVKQRVLISQSVPEANPAYRVFTLAGQLDSGIDGEFIRKYGSAESAVGDFNDIRTDLNALNATLSPVNPLTRARYGEASDGISSSYRIAMRAAYCYRPHHLYCGIELHQDNPSGGREYQWKVDFIDENDQSAEIYESAETESPSEWFWDFEEIDLSAGDAATALSGAGITLSLGSYYRVKISARRSSGTEELSIRGAIVARTSDQDPDGSWDDPTDWAHGDNDIGPTNMNIHKTDLLLLYSGNEQLYPRTHAHAYTDDEVRTFTGVHRKRWLWYLRVPDEIATLHFGVDYLEDSDLDDDGSGDWEKQDLTEVGIPWGAYYRVSGCQCAMENDGA